MTNKLDFSNRENPNQVDALIIERWSPRAFEKIEIQENVLNRIMDAARWSPSCFNAQPWRFYTSTQQTFSDFLGLLVEGNQAWAKDTSVIGNGKVNMRFSVFVVSPSGRAPVVASQAELGQEVLRGGASGVRFRTAPVI